MKRARQPVDWSLQRVKEAKGDDYWVRPSKPRQNVHTIQGKHGLAGYSRLDEDVQQEVAEMLGREPAPSISEIARVCGCSRDQVRTIRNRMAGTIHREVRAARRQMEDA